jgi:hypothetical protein
MGKNIRTLSTEKLITLNVGDEYTKEEIRGEIAIRIYICENESELQTLWKVFKELT